MTKYCIVCGKENQIEKKERVTCSRKCARIRDRVYGYYLTIWRKNKK